MSRDYILSPLNFTGGKYKLLPQILPLFPTDINTFVDIFCGGCNVGVNVKAKHIICNDIDFRIIGLMNYFKSTTYDVLKTKIDKIIQDYRLSDSTRHEYSFYDCTSASGLGSYNRDKFLALREYFNNLEETKSDYYLYFYILIVFSFNNQIRFNSDGQYNLPVGKRDFNTRMQKKLKGFLSHIGNIEFRNSSFETIAPDSLGTDDFVYADPPYLITCATYNEKNGWNEDKEYQLLNYLDSLSNRNIKFALSNVLSSNGKENTILKDWVNNHSNYKCHHLDFSYKNSNYHKKQTSDKTDEVLITNY